MGCLDPLLDQGLQAVLREHGVGVLAAGVEARSLIPAVEHFRPDTVILDETASPTPSQLEQIWRTHSSLSVVVLAHELTDPAVARFAHYGVALVSKSAPVHELIGALTKPPERSSFAQPGRRLTAREAHVAKLVREQHLTHREIAKKLHISVATARSHTASIRRKLGISSTRQIWD